MTNEQKETNRIFVKMWHENMLNLEEKAESWQAAADIFFYDTAQGKAVSSVMGGYTDALSLAIDDQGDWLNWYWLENHMGKKGLPAARDHERPLKKIEGVDDLLWLLFLDEK